MWVGRLAADFWDILTGSAVFILTGFLLASVLHLVLSRGRWIERLKGLGARSVLLATAVGLPLPLCSCAVLPAAVSLRRQGAGKGAVLAFLISTPETGITSILLTYGLLGPIMAIFRPVAACVTALSAGWVENLLERWFPVEAGQGRGESGGGCGCAAEAPAPPNGGPANWRDGFRHAFVDVFDDVVGWILIGVLVSAVIQTAVPALVIQAVFGPPWQAMLLMLAIGIPMYVCAEASTPLAAVLVAQGLNPGAALVFLLAGPATNIGSLGVLARELGRRTVAVYLAVIAVVSLAMGTALNWVFGAGGIDLRSRAMETPWLPGWVKAAGAVVFLLLFVGTACRQQYGSRLIALLNTVSPVRLTSRRVAAAAGMAVVLVVLGSGFYRIEPGEIGMVRRFGRLVARDMPPGLYLRWPWPIEQVDRLAPERVERVVLGFKAGGTEEEGEDADEAWLMLGDENLANVKSAAHWHMKPGASERFAYGTADQARLVRCALRAGLREALGDATIDNAYAADRPVFAARVRAAAQTVLDDCASGVVIDWCDFLDLHAPPAVHESFRDVASAMEDKATRRDQALTYQAKVLPLARGQADKVKLDAQSYGLRTTAEAVGGAARFTELLRVYGQYPAVTRVRLVHEMYDRVLPGLRKCIKPDSGDFLLDLRFERGARRSELPR